MKTSLDRSSFLSYNNFIINLIYFYLSSLEVFIASGEYCLIEDLASPPFKVPVTSYFLFTTKSILTMDLLYVFYFDN